MLLAEPTAAAPMSAVLPEETLAVDAVPPEEETAVLWLALDEDETGPSDAAEEDGEFAVPDDVDAVDAPTPACTERVGIAAAPKGGAACTGAITGAAKIVLFTLGTSVSK